MSNKTEVVYFPKGSGNNSYVSINKEIIRGLEEFHLNSNVAYRDFLKLPFLLNGRFKNTIVVFNWWENFLVKKNGSLSFVGIIKYFIGIFLIKIHRAKLVYVRHNLYPHNMKVLHSKLAKKIISMGENISDRKVSLSPHLESYGYQYLPHPLYNNGILEDPISSNSDYYVIFGRIQRYKNIEKVIAGWKGGTKLVIAGSSDDIQYLSEIKSLSEKKNIEIISDTLSDIEAERLIRASSGLIISHSNPNTIVSGSFFFGLGCGVTIFSLKTNFLSFLVEHNWYPGLVLASSIDELVNEIKNFEKHELKIDHKKLYCKANSHFGLAEVAVHWERILTF